MSISTLIWAALAPIAPGTISANRRRISGLILGLRNASAMPARQSEKRSQRNWSRPAAATDQASV